ncbi:MAG: hypothetical protein AB7G28_05115 [Pirellulales bacterium]
MTYRGLVKDGLILLDPGVSLPEGAEVHVEVIEARQNGEELQAVLLRHAGKGQGLPKDLAERHDCYAHGKPTS